MYLPPEPNSLPCNFACEIRKKVLTDIYHILEEALVIGGGLKKKEGGIREDGGRKEEEIRRDESLWKSKSENLGAGGRRKEGGGREEGGRREGGKEEGGKKEGEGKVEGGRREGGGKEEVGKEEGSWRTKFESIHPLMVYTALHFFLMSQREIVKMSIRLIYGDGMERFGLNFLKIYEEIVRGIDWKDFYDFEEKAQIFFETLACMYQYVVGFTVN